jgi:predicted secreted protein
MGIAGSLMVISIAWWLAFIVLLPIGDRAQIDEGHVVPGTDPSAPANDPRLGRKAVLALGVALVVWLGLFWLVENVSLDDIAWLTGGKRQ